ncbi:MAG: hypothetical protein HGB04_07905 [Chlorobiaceae bacterium]|nr:hypothetical protein [Chlorobiaceae bacterium]
MAVTVLMVCHSGAGTGLGHLTRSLVAARGLAEAHGFDIRFLIQGDAIDREDLRRFPHRFVPFEYRLDTAIRETLDDRVAGIVVFDLDPRLIPDDFGAVLSGLHQSGWRLVSIDPLKSLHGLLDLIYVPSFSFKPPEGADPGKFLYGWERYLLNVSASPRHWHRGTSVLVLTGGSDATGLGRTLPAILDMHLPAGSDLHWVVGPYAAPPVFPKSPRLSFLPHTGLSGLDSLTGWTEYALTVYGVSFFELLYFGIPTVVFSPYGTKDDDELSAIAAAGVALVARDEEEAVVQLSRLMQDDALAASISERSRRHLSAGGPERFAHALQALTSQPCHKDI